MHTYYEGEVVTRRADGTRYRLIVTCPLDMGPVQAAITARAAVERWHPAQVLLVGIAGGITGRVALGDVIVARSVSDYTLVRAVSDLADAPDNAGAKAQWRGYACDAAAAYAVGLLEEGPMSKARPAGKAGRG